MTARALAKAAGAAQRAAPHLAPLLGVLDQLPIKIARQAVRAIEELDLLRHLLREEVLQNVVAPPPKQRLRAAGGHARAAKLTPAQRKSIAAKGGKARSDKFRRERA